MRRICQARGEKPQPLKFLSPVLGSGTGITAKLTSWPSREAQASGWRRPCFSVSVSALWNFLSSCLEVGKLLVLTLLCRALGTSLSPGRGGPWRSDHWRWSSEPLLTSSQYLCAKSILDLADNLSSRARSFPFHTLECFQPRRWIRQPRYNSSVSVLKAGRAHSVPWPDLWSRVLTRIVHRVSKPGHLHSIQEPHLQYEWQPGGSTQSAGVSDKAIWGGTGRARGVYMIGVEWADYTPHASSPTSCRAGLSSDSHRIRLRPCTSWQVTAFWNSGGI